MQLNIFQDQPRSSKPPRRPLDIGRGDNVIRRNVRQDPRLQPGDEIYERARIIFSRARRAGGSGASNIL